MHVDKQVNISAEKQHGQTSGGSHRVRRNRANKWNVSLVTLYGQVCINTSWCYLCLIYGAVISYTFGTDHFVYSQLTWVEIKLWWDTDVTKIIYSSSKCIKYNYNKKSISSECSPRCCMLADEQGRKYPLHYCKRCTMHDAVVRVRVCSLVRETVIYSFGSIWQYNMHLEINYDISDIFAGQHLGIWRSIALTNATKAI